MEAFSSKKLFASLLILFASSFILYPAQAIEKAYQETSTKFIRTSCSTTTYPRLCFSSLAKHASFIQTNRVLLTGTSLNVTLASAKATSVLMSTLSKSQGLKPREVAAMKDCPDQISPWLVEWMPNKGGYLIGNLQPAHMDFRFFSLGNLWSVVSSLATMEQSHAILDLIEAKWADLVAEMPFKICYPALDGQEWQIITGSDPKNTPWSYHNAGSWPTLLWQLAVACIKMDRPHIAAKAVEVAERRISQDKWPEYYDTKRSRFIGKQAQLFQTWSIAGYLVAKLLLADPSKAKILITVEDSELVNALISANPRKKRGRKNLKQTYIV